MPALISALKNEHTKRILRATRIRPPAGTRGKTPHYRMPMLEAAGGYLVQLLRMSPNTLRECRWGLHLDNNNQGNPESSGWIVRVWMELTDDPASVLVMRPAEFDRKGEIRIPLPRYQQVVIDSETLYHAGPQNRYAVIVSVESGPALERWIQSQLPA